jgi:hypothetical protein
VDRKRHSVTINAKEAALAAFRRIKTKKDSLDYCKLKVAELKAILTMMQADTRGSKQQALVNRCLDKDVALEIKEQVLEEAAEEGDGDRGGGRGRLRGWDGGQ